MFLGPNGIWRWLTVLPFMSVWNTPSTGGSGGLCTDAPLAPLQTKPLPTAMPLQSTHSVTTLCSTLPLRSSSQAVSGPLSWRCCCTQKPRPCGSAVMALGQQGGVRNSLVVRALRRGNGLACMLASVRPNSSVPGFCVCANARWRHANSAMLRQKLPLVHCRSYLDLKEHHHRGTCPGPRSCR